MKNLLKDKISMAEMLIYPAMIIAFFPTFARLVTYGWKSAGYTHAYFILPISLYLIWRKRKELKRAKELNWMGAFLFLLGLLCYIYGAKNQFMFIEAPSFLFVMWGTFLLQFDQTSVKKVAFPLSYLIFMVPPPGLAIDTLTYPLKIISTTGAYILLGLFDIPVKIYGAILRVGNQELFMADACSGFRFVITLLALGAVYAYFQETTKTKKWLVFLLVIPIALLGNILRITSIGLIAYGLGSEFAMKVFHDYSGLVLFAFTALGLVLVTQWMIHKDEDYF